MTDQEIYELNRIIYWKNEIKRIEDFTNNINTSHDSKPVLEITRKIKYFPFFSKTKRQEFVLSDDIFTMIYGSLIETKEHLETLIEKSNVDLVHLADLIIKKEITPEGY